MGLPLLLLPLDVLFLLASALSLQLEFLLSGGQSGPQLLLRLMHCRKGRQGGLLLALLLPKAVVEDISVPTPMPPSLSWLTKAVVEDISIPDALLDLDELHGYPGANLVS